MEDIKDLVSHLAKGMHTLQALQQEYDAVGWQISHPPFDKFQHVSLHIGIVAGKVASLSEAGDHLAHSASMGSAEVNPERFREDLKPILADLLIHSAQLANLVQVSLGDCLIGRHASNAKRFAPTSRLAALEDCSTLQ